MKYIEAMCSKCGCVFSIDEKSHNENSYIKCNYCHNELFAKNAVLKFKETFCRVVPAGFDEINNTNNNIDLSIFDIEDGVLREYRGNDLKVVIPKEVKVIGKDAFVDLQLTTVVLHEDLEILELRSFNNCTRLREVFGMKYVKEFQGYNFLNCISLEEADISSARLLNNAVFAGCRGLKKVTGLKDKTHIPDYMFLNCDSLEEIDVDNATSIGTGAFASCAGLKKLSVSKDALFSKGSKDEIRSWCYYSNNGSSYFNPGRCPELREICVDGETYKIELNEFNENSPEVIRLEGSRFLDDIRTKIKWKLLGLCPNCGGTYVGFLKKRCKDCGQEGG